MAEVKILEWKDRGVTNILNGYWICKHRGKNLYWNTR